MYIVLMKYLERGTYRRSRHRGDDNFKIYLIGGYVAVDGWGLASCCSDGVMAIWVL